LTFRSLAAVEGAARIGGWPAPEFRLPEHGFSLEATIDTLVKRALDQTEGNVSAAARMLGVSRDYVRYRLKPAEGAAALGGSTQGQTPSGDLPPIYEEKR